jgi:hypothetical protein
MPIITTVQLTGVGGTAPYTFLTPVNALTSLPNGTYSITGVNSDQLRIDSTTLSPGVYTLFVQIVDSTPITPNVSSKVLNVRVVDPTLFTILNENQNFSPASFPSAVTIPLLSSGGTGAVTWSLIPNVTTLPGVTLDISNNLVFSLTTFGSWTVGVQAKDSLGNISSKVLLFKVVSAQVFQLVDGQVEVLVNVPPTMTGVNNFTLSVQDSLSTTKSQTFNYTAVSPVSDVRIKESSFDHYWGVGDTTSIVLPIIGNLSGFSLGSVTSPLPSNGLTVTIDNADGVVKVAGAASSFANSEIFVPIVLLQGNNQVATITRQYTLIAHDGTVDIGELTVNTRPYLTGEFVGLNPQKPYFNSPSIFKANGLTVRMKNGSSLPAGLSLDANTGLIYGFVVSALSVPSIVEYVDSTGLVHGTVTINWDIQKNSFSLVDNLNVGQIQQTYTGTIGSTSQANLTTVSVYRGRLPVGLTATIDVNGTTVDITGKPTEAGYFDIWFRVTNTNGQDAFLYHRMVIDYITPLVVLTSSLPSLVKNTTYTQLLQGYGGIQPYTWALDAGSPALPTLGGLPYNAGTNPLAFHLTSSGLLTGKTDLNSYNQNIIINLTDSRSPNVTTSAILNLVENNTLTITTPTLPNIIPGQTYLFQMTAIAGTPPYTWSLPGGFTLPSGITFNTSTGTFSGVTSSNYSQNVTITVTDSAAGSANKQYTLQTGAASGMLIDTSGVGAVDRGAPYQGLLRAFGTFTAPVSWAVAADTPNALPSGLVLNANSSDQGVTATISGVYSGSPLTGYSVKIIAIDNAGNTAQIFVLLSTTSSLRVTTASLPRGTVGVAYSVQLTASGVNTPFTWSLDGSSPALPGGYSITSGGLLQGTTGSAYAQNIVVKVTDALSNTATATLNLTVQNSTLAITTASLTNITSGLAYSAALAGSGGTPAYAWSVSPNSTATLPVGITLDPASGALAGSIESDRLQQVSHVPRHGLYHGVC